MSHFIFNSKGSDRSVSIFAIKWRYNITLQFTNDHKEIDLGRMLAFWQRDGEERRNGVPLRSDQIVCIIYLDC